MAAVSDLAKETHQALGNFNQERKKQGRDMQRSFASSRLDRTRHAQEMRTTRMAQVSDRVRATHQVLGNFNQERIQQSREFKQSLASSRSERLKHIQDLRTTRRAHIADLASDTHHDLRDFNENREKQERDLKHTLSSHEKERKGEFGALIEDIKDAVTTIGRDTTGMLADFRSDHEEMAATLKSELASFHANHEEMATSLRSELTAFHSDLSKEVDDLLADFSAMHRQTHANWENLISEMAAKRASKVASSGKTDAGVRILGQVFPQVARGRESF